MKKTAVILGLALWAITGLPTLFGYLATPPDQVYLARIPVTPADTPAYYSNIEQARQGGWLFSNQFTGEPQSPSLFHPVWLVTGWLGALTTLSTPIVYQVVRLGAVGLFMLIVTQVIQSIWDNRKHQLLALVLVTTSAGFGWMIGTNPDSNLLFIPPDRWVAESNTFRSIGHSALFIGSQALLLWCVWRLWRWTEKQQDAFPWAYGPAIGLLTLIHPYDCVTIAAVMLVWMVVDIFRNSNIRNRLIQWTQLGGWVMLWTFPMLAYYRWVVLAEPAMSGWLERNIDITPTPQIVILGYAPLLILAAMGWRHLRRSVAWLLTAWVLATAIIIYLPWYDFQRRLLSGVHIPIALIASQGLFTWRRILSPRFIRPLATVLVLVFLSVTNIKNLMNDIGIQLVPQSVDYPLTISRDEYDAMKAYRDRSTFNDVLWSQIWIGNALPGVIGRTVVMGHGHQTLNLKQRQDDWANFRDADFSTDERTNLLDQLGVTWLFWRTIDQNNARYQPAIDPRWTVEYTNSSVTLFRLKPD